MGISNCNLNSTCNRLVKEPFAVDTFTEFASPLVDGSHLALEQHAPTLLRAPSRVAAPRTHKEGSCVMYVCGSMRRACQWTFQGYMAHLPGFIMMLCFNYSYRSSHCCEV